ncbi:hypothetical protein NOL65_20130 [Vibrio parahaemolyticus]|uniref:hypothetical protein n=1 Tax=Vibrio parahaemolyticus TaxID=670 RepID=UPI00226B42A8|nr:hypothetical protein [Vibrio parahaemolyticus]MCX8914831.1 hypothetical protein [Vibrio parahaemolyticus]
MEIPSQEAVEQFWLSVKQLPHDRKIMTDYCRKHGFRSPDSVSENFEIASSIKIQGSLAV